MSQDRERITITLEREDYDALVASAKSNDRSVSGEARHAVREYLKPSALPLSPWQPTTPYPYYPGVWWSSTTTTIPAAEVEDDGEGDGD